MTKIKGITIIAVLLCSLAILNTVQASEQLLQQNEFKGSWSFYEKSLNFSLSNGINGDYIIFSIPGGQVNTTNFQITQQGYWKSSYISKSAQINVVGLGQNLLAKIKWLDTSMLNVTVHATDKLSSNDKIYVLHDRPPQTEQYLWQVNGCTEVNSSVSNGGMSCSFNFSKVIEIQYDTTGLNGANIANIRKIMDQKSQTNITSFLQNLKINPKSTDFTQRFAKEMLQNTLSSICSQKISYYEDRYFGLCSSSNPKQIDLHYSLLVIDVLFNYNAGMGVWLTENFLDLLEEKLFYEFKDKEWIPVPQHIEVFVTYLRYIQKSKSLSETEIRMRVNKVIQIQNGLINSLLLSQVNHLSEQINYRQNNKIHPTILKMLTQDWKTDSPRARVSSIYAESFTNDFYYHQQNEKLDSSVGKMMWVIKLINQHITVVKTWGDSYQKQSMEQLVSLAKVMHGYVLDDPRAQNGDFHSIIEAENHRLYTRSIGYESLLPFAYDISSVFPTTTMLNLTTSTGLASMPLAHEKAKQTYNFRGNINLYFNYKILFSMIHKCESNQKLKVFYPGLKTVIQSIQRSIIATYAEGENSDYQKFYTSWTAKGKGVSSQRHLAVINLAFLEELKSVPSATPSKESKAKQPSKKQSTQ